jgi:glycosyltransferase involved in cell wall biosynthesis
MCPDGGDAELARDGENCLLAEAANPDSYARAILKLMEQPALPEELADRAYREVHQYDIETISRQIEDFLKRVTRPQ